MLNKIRKQTEGFTIIEVLIVLAIAALILLIVFLAVPALQRNQRNTSRKNDVSRIGGAVTEFSSNNNGKLPAAGDGNSTDTKAIVTSAGNLGQYDFVANPTKINTIQYSNAGAWVIQAATYFGTGGGNKPTDNIVIVTKASCNGNTPQTGNDRQAAIVYSTETTSSTPVILCVDI